MKTVDDESHYIFNPFYRVDRVLKYRSKILKYTVRKNIFRNTALQYTTVYMQHGKRFQSFIHHLFPCYKGTIHQLI